MLANFEKYHLFAQALAPVVVGNDVVDIGAGSGILSLICLALGARSVIAVERPEVAKLTRDVLNTFANPSEIRIVAKDVFDATKEELNGGKVIVSETIGYLGFEENIAPLMAYAKQASGVESAVMIPRSLSLSVAGVSAVPGLPRRRPFTSTSPYPVAALSPVGEVPGPFLLGGMPPDNMRWEWHFKSDAPQLLSGVVFSFTADLGCGYLLSNRDTSAEGKDAESAMKWPRLVCPLPEPWSLAAAAEEFAVTLELRSREEESGNALSAYSCTIRCSIGSSRDTEMVAVAPGFSPDYYPCGRDIAGGVRSVLAGLGLLDRLPGFRKERL